MFKVYDVNYKKQSRKRNRILLNKLAPETGNNCVLNKYVNKPTNSDLHYPSESIGLKFIPSQSELFRFIPISVSEPMRIIPNQSEKRFLSLLMKNSKHSIRPNSI